MKKILLGMILLCLYSVNIFSQVDRITGINQVYTGEKQLYHIWFKNALTADTKFTVTTGKYGAFSNSTDTLQSFTVSKGKTYHEFWITWGNTATNNAKITAYKNGDAPSSAKTYSIKIIEKETDPNPGVNWNTIHGDNIVYTGSEVVYDRNLSSYYMCQAGTSYSVKWNYDKNLLEHIKLTKDDCTTNAYLTLKVKEINRESIITNIEANVTEYENSKIVAEFKKDMKKVTIKYKPTLGLTTGANLICSDAYVNYSITGIKPFMTNYTITWETSANMTIVSGQGTPNATFRGSGNGIGKVKATVTYDGKTYVLENSDLWVGPSQYKGKNPLSQTAFVFIPENSYSYVDSEIEGATSYYWTSDKQFSIVRGNTNKEVYICNNEPKGILLTVEARNKCDASPLKRTFAIVPFDPNPGEPIIDPGINPGRPGSGKSLSPSNLPETTNLSSPVSIKVYNFTTGTTVYQEKNIIDFNIQNTNLKAGIYIIETTDKDGNKTTEKVYKKD